MRLEQKSVLFHAHLMENEGNKSTFITGCVNVNHAYAHDKCWVPAATVIIVESNRADAQGWQGCHPAGDRALLAIWSMRCHVFAVPSDPL